MRPRIASMLLITLGILAIAVIGAASTSTAGPSPSLTTACIHNAKYGRSYFWTKADAQLPGEYTVECDNRAVVVPIKVHHPENLFQSNGWLLHGERTDEIYRNALSCRSVYAPFVPATNPNAKRPITVGPYIKCTRDPS